jgi:hypothetical protein
MKFEVLINAIGFGILDCGLRICFDDQYKSDPLMLVKSKI